MVAKVIREYLAQGKNKLTVPGFGTFMKRDTGNIVFVDLLRTDDGVLAQLVEDAGKYSEVEAMALVDRFIFNSRRDIERMGRQAWEQSIQAELQPQKAETVRQKELFAEPAAEKPRPVQQRRPLPPPARSKRADTIIIIAVIAAAVAVIALAFGLSTGNMPFLR